VPLFAIKAWTWIKKNWKWLLFPIGALLGLIGFFWGRGSKKTDVHVASPVLADAETIRREAEEKAQEDIRKAEEEHKKEVARIESEYKETIAKLTDDQKTKVDELRSDPDKLTAFLLSVGKDIRQ
jgi:hypothetical protein